MAQAWETALLLKDPPQVVKCGRCRRTVVTFTLEEMRRDRAAWELKVHNAVAEHDVNFHNKPRGVT